MEVLPRFSRLCSSLLLIVTVVGAAVINNGNTHELVFLGSVDGKSFFSEGTIARTWTEARAHCNASHLELAAIETQAQVTMLRSKAVAGHDGFNKTFYWTGARDAHTRSQFFWDATNTQPSENITLEWILNYGSNHPYLTCAIIQGSRTQFRMIIEHCDRKWGTLCQTPDSRVVA